MSQETTFDLSQQLTEEARDREAKVAIVMYKWEDRKLKELESNPPRGYTHNELFAMSSRYHKSGFYRLGAYYLEMAKEAKREHDEFMEAFKSIILATSRARIKSSGGVFVVIDKAIATDHDIIVKLDNCSWYRYEEVSLV